MISKQGGLINSSFSPPVDLYLSFSTRPQNGLVKSTAELTFPSTQTMMRFLTSDSSSSRGETYIWFAHIWKCTSAPGEMDNLTKMAYIICFHLHHQEVGVVCYKVKIVGGWRRSSMYSLGILNFEFWIWENLTIRIHDTKVSATV